jgi:hypothetical protein
VSSQARVSLLTGYVTYIDTPLGSVDVAVGSQFVYVLCSSNGGVQAVVSVYDRVTGDHVADVAVPAFSSVIAATPLDPSSSFFVAALGVSGGVALTKYSRVGSVDAGHGRWTGQQWYQTLHGDWTLAYNALTNGETGNSLAVSPDGHHVLFAAGGGNGDGYSVIDYDASNLTTIYGSYQTGAYPTGTTPSPSSSSSSLSSSDRNTPQARRTRLMGATLRQATTTPTSCLTPEPTPSSTKQSSPTSPSPSAHYMCRSTPSACTPTTRTPAV